MLLAFPAVRNEITKSQDVPFFWSLLARGIIPQVQRGIKAPIMLERIIKIMLLEERIFSKKLSGITSARIAEINNAKRKAGIMLTE